MYPYPTVAASNPRSAYSRPETVSAMHPSPKSASRREFGTLRPRKGTLKVYNHVSFRNLFDFAKHRSPLPATSIPACPGRQKKFRTPYAAASSIIRKSKCSTDFKRNDFLKKTKRTHWVRFVHLNSLIESCVFLYLWNSPFDTFL